MDMLTNLAQILIAIAMFDVWLLRYDRPQRARGGDAKTMAEEFEVYGLPGWLRNLVRILKLTAGALMVLGIWSVAAAFAAGVALVVLMAGAIVMHAKVSDPLYKWLPATFFFLLSLWVAWVHRGVVMG